MLVSQQHGAALVRAQDWRAAENLRFLIASAHLADFRMTGFDAFNVIEKGYFVLGDCPNSI